MKGKNSILIAAIVLMAIVAAAVYRVQKIQPPPAPSGPSVPDIATKTIDGKAWRLSDQRGKVLLMDFWATWCGPCVASMPHMKQVYERFKSDPDFVMVGVSDDRTAQDVRRFVEREKIPWLQLFDPEQPLARAFQIDAIPSVWVLDREQRVAGARLDPDEIESTVAAALARK